VKISKKYLKKVIVEEVKKILNEGPGGSYGGALANPQSTACVDWVTKEIGGLLAGVGADSVKSLMGDDFTDNVFKIADTVPSGGGGVGYTRCSELLRSLGVLKKGGTPVDTATIKGVVQHHLESAEQGTDPRLAAGVNI